MVPPIPPDVPNCHKNYQESLGTLIRVTNDYMNLSDLDYYHYLKENNKSPSWYTLEEFYNHSNKKEKEEQKSNPSEDDKELIVGGSERDDKVGRVRVRNYDTEYIAEEYGDDFDYDNPDKDNGLWDIIRNIHKIIDESFIDKRSNKYEEDLESEEMDIVELKNIKDIAKSNARNNLAIEELEALAYYDAIQGNLHCLKPSRPIKKALHILLDNSGSMCHSIKLLLVDEILEYCASKIDENTEVFIHTFVIDILDSYSLTNSEAYYNPGGGDTRIDISINTIFNELKEDNDYDLTSILIVNDGQDYINPEYVPPHKVSCISIGLHNQFVEEVVKKSDGIYYSIELED